MATTAPALKGILKGGATNKPSRKRKAKIAFAEPNEHDAVTAPAVSDPSTTVPHTNGDNIVEVTDAATQLSPGHKNRKTTSKTKKSPSPPKPTETVPTHLSPPTTTLSPIVLSKIQRVHAHIHKAQTNAPSSPTLTRDGTNPHLISIAESSVISALVRLKLHFEMGDPNSVALAEVVAVRRYEEKRTEFTVPCVTIDVSKPTLLEERIKRKIAGKGLEYVNLLEIELEMVKDAEAKRFSRDHLAPHPRKCNVGRPVITLSKEGLEACSCPRPRGSEASEKTTPRDQSLL